MIDTSRNKLGKLDAKLDNRTLQYEAYVTGKLPPPPNEEIWSKAVHTPWPMMENDKIGDCTCACAGHMVECWTANVRNGKPTVIPDEDILQAYKEISGYVPGNPNTDTGATVLDLLNHWRTTGIGAHKIDAYVSIEPGNLRQIQESIFLFGGCYLGLRMPISAQTQEIWSVPPGGPAGMGEPGSWGGHAVPVVDYDSRGFTIVSWGRLFRMTHRFLTTYCDEAYAALSVDWFSARGRAPDGFNMSQLTTDLSAITTENIAKLQEFAKRAPAYH